MQGKRLTLEQEDYVKLLFNEGAAVTEIAKELRYHPNTVKKIIEGERPHQLKKKVPEGRRLCGCCKQALVPKKPFRDVTLLRLCIKCYSNEENDDNEDFVCNPFSALHT
jgi:hypothetical protein